MYDLARADTVEIQVEPSTGRVWVNINGTCQLRVDRSARVLFTSTDDMHSLIVGGEPIPPRGA